MKSLVQASRPLTLAFALVSLSGVALSGGVLADEATGPATAAADGPTFRITPKVQYYIQSTNLRSDSLTSQSSSAQFTLPFYGATVDAILPQFRNTEFSLSVTHGAGSFKTVVVNSTGAINDLRTAVNRTDTELTVRNFVPQTDFNWTYGFRWIHAPYDLTFQNAGTYSDTGTSKREVNHDYYVLLIGGNIDTPVSASGVHRVFGGVNLGIGYQDDSCGNCNGAASPANQHAGVVLPEMNFGYKYMFSPKNFVYARYKFQGTAGEAGTHGGLFDEMQWGHGPEVGISAVF
jgi:hypothetical protein